MSLSHEVTIWCDNCITWEQRSGTAKDLRKELKARGWTSTSDSGVVSDYCPVCSAERRKASAEANTEQGGQCDTQGS
jgi:hypothetical protein